MKVNKININPIYKRNFGSNKIHFTNNIDYFDKAKKDSNIKQTSFTDKIKSIFITKKPTAQEIKSAQIQELNKSAKILAKNSIKESKKNYREFIKIYYKGDKNNYNSIHDLYNEENNPTKTPKNLNFTDFDELNMPKIANIWQNGKLYKSYNVDCFIPSTYLKVTDCSDKSKTKTFYMLNDTLLSYYEKDNDTNIAKMIVPMRKDFYYAQSSREDFLTSMENPDLYFSQNRYHENVNEKERVYCSDQKSKLWLEI